MSWHYSRALVEEFLGENFSDGELCAPAKLTPTPAAYYWPDKTMGHSRLSRFGMTSEPLTGCRGAELLTLFLADSRARTSAQPEAAQDLTAPEAGFGQKWRGSFAKYDPATFSWKTRQFSLLGDCVEFSETWPRWGSMRNGECWERPMSERPTGETESGLWPTPTCGGGGQTLPEGTTPQGKTPEGRKQTVCLERYVQQVERKVWPTPTATAHKGWSKSHNRARTDDRLDYTVEREASESGLIGRLNPQFVEWLMGWPIGWTELQHLETGRFREWLQQHGGT